MVAYPRIKIQRSDVDKLDVHEREKLLKPYLPTKPLKVTKGPKRQPVRMFLRTQLHFVVFTAIHMLFSLYIRFRQAFHIVLDRVFAILYYHHRAPELIRQDIRGLERIPQHLSVILETKHGEHGLAGLEKLLDDVAEISAWCAGAGIPMLSVYERTGLEGLAASAIGILGTDEYGVSPSAGHLSILLLSEGDGRATLVDLTKTLTEMSQRNKISADDISLDLIDAEISESVMPEPDLLILFGPYVKLQGYPPWQVRLTEIYHSQDNCGVGYQVFLRALYNFAKAQMKFGR
ncbi:MAG: hypothetical protein Q9178_007364 [Gyalolechia marmorata]